MKFLVTGGAGFIGSHTCELLIKTGFEVRVLDNLKGGRSKNLKSVANSPLFEFVEGDILNELHLKSCLKGITHVIHFAGIGEIVPSINSPIEYLEVNVLGTAKLLEACRTAQVESFVYAASSSCYGLASTPTNEDAPIDLKHPYAVSKYLGEQLSLKWHEIYGLPTKSIRIFNAYGRRVRTSGTYGAVLGVFLKQKIENRPLTVVGDGNQIRDYVHVTDVAHAFLRAALSTKNGRVWNLGSGVGTSIKRLVEILESEFVNIPDRPGEPKETLADISRITAELDWSPLVSFEEGLSEVIRNIHEWKDAPLWEPENIAQATENWFQILDRKER